ncbi:acyl-CoA N-acyltransferase [Microdochium trichocladiopsis]|uniref:Acyl-CoA N-acyltransferase n=1 Tax=Microdochium trichocladiopsis TaxID=1682393 RepID=A0A9P8Y0Y6_9PEZI|nr:acyl-CoA N-acyltransferase [Microdochium trichocladiopsis]KAH7026495.1 acyl-CoA N-acyltransferase [Microdochium trichocladiopsis]
MADSQPQSHQQPSWLTSPPPPPIIITPTFYLRAYTLADAAQLAKTANSSEIAHRMGDRFPSPYTHADGIGFITRFGRPNPEAGVRDHNFGIFTRSLATITGATERDTADGKDKAGGVGEEETLIGGIGFMPQPAEQRFTSEIGYWLHPSVWGKGLATKVVREFVRWAFTNFGDDTLVKLQARHHAGNERSGRVLEKNGFQREGILRKAWACRDDGDTVRAGQVAEAARREGQLDAAGSEQDASAKPKHYVLDLYIYGLLREDFEAGQSEKQ